jgi:hypothetical protein
MPALLPLGGVRSSKTTQLFGLTDLMDMAIVVHDGLCWTYPTSICHVLFL